MRRLGLYFGLAFIFVRFSLLHEVLAYTWGLDTYLLLALAIPSLIGVVLSGGIRRAFQRRPTFYWVGFGFWLILAIPFSSWPGDSVSLVLWFYRTQLPVAFVMAGLVIGWREVKWLMYTVAVAGIVNALTGALFRQDRAQRLQLDFGTVGNANDFAAHLLLILPFVLFVFLLPGRSVARRLITFLVMLYGLYLIASTGSRGALVALLASLVFVLVHAPQRLRLAFGIAIPLLGLMSIVVLPGHVLRRYGTLIDDEEGLSNEAVGSQYARTYLLKTSLKFTFQHPLFGVGPGQFANYEGSSARRAGERGAWQVSHNSYTQASSEGGIPALLFVIAALVSTYRLLNGVYRKARAQPAFREIAAAAFCLMLSLVAFCTATLFLSMIYRFYMPALSCLAVAFACAADSELAAGTVPATRPAPAGWPGLSKVTVRKTPFQN